MRAITTTPVRRSAILTAFIVVALSAVAAFALSTLAHADTIPVDAGEIIADAGPQPTAGPVIVPDPTVDPSAFVDDVIKLWNSGGWVVLLLVVAVGALNVTAWLGRNRPSLAWLARGRARITIAGALAVVSAALNALASDGAWSAVLMAAVAAVLAFWHPAGTDPAKAATPPTDAPPRFGA